MSLLLSDSLEGVISEDDLLREGFDFLGKIYIAGKEYVIDAFITDRKSIRIHAEGEPEDAFRFLHLKPESEVRVVLGDDAFVAKGKLQQIGWENLPHGGRLVISVSVSNK